MNETGRDEAIVAARGVMSAHFKALNARDEFALSSTLHFPHYRLSGGTLRTWTEPDDYFSDFLARAGDGWHHSTLDVIDVIAADADKVHLDVRFTRYREDGSRLGTFRSMWVIAKLEDHWAAQLRSSFAA